MTSMIAPIPPESSMRSAVAERVKTVETSTKAMPYELWEIGIVRVVLNGGTVTLNATIPKSAALTEEDRIIAVVGQIELLLASMGHHNVAIDTERRQYTDEDDGVTRPRILLSLLMPGATPHQRFEVLDALTDFLAEHGDPLVRDSVTIRMR